MTDERNATTNSDTSGPAIAPTGTSSGCLQVVVGLLILVVVLLALFFFLVVERTQTFTEAYIVKSISFLSGREHATAVDYRQRKKLKIGDDVVELSFFPMNTRTDRGPEKCRTKNNLRCFVGPYQLAFVYTDFTDVEKSFVIHKLTGRASNGKSYEFVEEGRLPLTLPVERLCYPALEKTAYSEAREAYCIRSYFMKFETVLDFQFGEQETAEIDFTLERRHDGKAVVIETRLEVVPYVDTDSHYFIPVPTT